jgi:hypothetical protein
MEDAETVVPGQEGDNAATGAGARAKRWIDFDVDGRRIIEMFKGEDCEVEVKDAGADFHRATACLAVACIKIVMSHEKTDMGAPPPDPRASRRAAKPGTPNLLIS